MAADGHGFEFSQIDNPPPLVDFPPVNMQCSIKIV